MLDELKKQIGSKIRKLKIDVDKNQDVAATFNLRVVPTFMLFTSGEIIWKESGAFPPNSFKVKIQAVL